MSKSTAGQNQQAYPIKLFYNLFKRSDSNDLNENLHWRCSRALSTTYLANFHLNVKRDYRRAIELCDEVMCNFVEEDTIDKRNRLFFILFCSTDMAPLFYDDIQSMFGLITLYDTILQASTSEPTQVPIRIHISAMALHITSQYAAFKNCAFRSVIRMKNNF